ncbi:ABC transporter ATP-binding protein [Kineothrix sedimenti]|uniref:ABC transporter ATP-binding protein n=1 Tax=Kineothrix sedimenti TaxID=3123317 RepID=A0ABZ3EZS5_9FIRM
MYNQTNKKTGNISWLLQLAGKKKVNILLACLFSVSSAILSFVPYICVYFILREILKAPNNPVGISFGTAGIYAWLALGAVGLGLLFSFISSVLSHGAAYKILFELRMKFAEHISELPMGFHTSNSTGKLRKLMDENVEKIELFIAHQLPDAVGALASPVVMLIVLFLFDWRMGLACLLPIVLSFIAQAGNLSNPKSREFMDSFQDLQDKMNSSAVEYVRGIYVVKAFNQTVYSFRKFHDTILEYKDSAIRYTHSVKNTYCAFLVLLNSVFLFLLPVGILIGSRERDYQAFAISFLFYLIFSMGVAGPVSKLMYVFVQSFMVLSSIKRVKAVFDTPVLKSAVKGEEPKGNGISFEHVFFSYNKDDENETLHDVSFVAEPGQVTALVGPSGSGKSTIAQLIPRFWDIDSGKITVGGVNITDIKPSDLMGAVSFVFQDVFLFKKSILENIKIGNENATDVQAIEAAKSAMCHEFIESLPNGYHSVLGSRGTYLSGGERQRIIIARAILKNAPIVILDEATAFADPENERKIQIALEKLMENKTVIVIAHRLSTIKNADKIIVVDDGKVAEEGTHEELIQYGAKYKHMWDVYNRALTWSLA